MGRRVSPEVSVERALLRRRFQGRGLVFDQAEQLARAIAGGLNLDWFELQPDSQALIRADAAELLRRYGRPPY